MKFAIRAAAAAAILTLALFSTALPAGEPVLWVEDSFEDFADGQLDAAGQNLYVSRDGALRTIHRFDLNRDGHLDLIFNSTHDNFTYIPATLGLMEPSRRVRRAELAVEGSLGVVLEDLNRDGHLDAVFCPNRSGLQNPRRLLTILWGAQDGWSNRRSHGQLPVYGALAVAAADLNRDQWPDIVTLNQTAWLPGQPQGNILRIFWGSPEGFLLTDTTELGIPQALDLAAGDFDGDGFKEAALLSGRGLVEVVRGQAAPGSPRDLTRQEVMLPGNDGLCLTAADADGDSRIDLLVGTDQGKVYFVGGKTGTGWGEPRSWAAPNASHIAAGDLNGDGQPDLVLTDFTLARAVGGEAAGAAESVNQPVRILWGSAEGFDAGRSTGLAIGYARSSAVGDLDGDGYQDLSVAVHQSSKQFETDSLVFFGTGSKVLDQHPLTLRTIGATDTAIVPPGGSLPGRVLFCNSLGGTVAERVPLHVYWGSPGGFSASNRWEIPFQSGYEASAADLNRDGYPDLIALNSQHAGDAAEMRSYRRGQYLLGRGRRLRSGTPANGPAGAQPGFQQRGRPQPRRLPGPGPGRLRSQRGQELSGDPLWIQRRVSAVRPAGAALRLSHHRQLDRRSEWGRLAGHRLRLLPTEPPSHPLGRPGKVLPGATQPTPNPLPHQPGSRRFQRGWTARSGGGQLQGPGVPPPRHGTLHFLGRQRGIPILQCPMASRIHPHRHGRGRLRRGRLPGPVLTPLSGGSDPRVGGLLSLLGRPPGVRHPQPDHPHHRLGPRRHGRRLRSGRSPGPGRFLPHPGREPPHRLQGLLQ